MNRKEIEKHIEYLEQDKYNNEFYVALLLYDVLGVRRDELTDEQIQRAYELQDEYDSIYNEDLRERLQYELEKEQEEELEK